MSCKKKNFHKITFEIKMLETPPSNYPNDFEITATPNYVSGKKSNTSSLNSNEIPHFDNPFPGSVWTYDYYGLEKKDFVNFNIMGKYFYYYEMRIYIDEIETSYMKIKVNNSQYYNDMVIERSGRNDNNDNIALIKFNY